MVWPLQEIGSGMSPFALILKIWDELGEHLKGSKVVIAKMDSTENDIPASAGYEVEGFPTLKLIKAETNEVVDYEGDRSMDSLFEFLKENALYADTFDELSPSDEPTKEEEDHDGMFFWGVNVFRIVILAWLSSEVDLNSNFHHLFYLLKFFTPYSLLD
jgi:hypothetical protein